ncbi:hypothetical protein K8B33_00905 [Alcanivorax sp. JB21]|uniref:hypothetical protein n=1 Tax=Alcanivorax limicola TaxID=2874102 RepID=UPI001CBC1040|nr:hypothetical protein [Alcanivorax limicola]MBZ2187642.1 hypothetical protein [Alcanivorax limicola]
MTETLPPGLTLTDKKMPGLLTRKRVFLITFAADDFDAFKPCYEAFSAALLIWYAKRGKRCGAVQIDATVHPWIAGRVKDYVRRLREIPGHAPLRNMTVSVTLQGSDGKPLEPLLLEKAEQ